MSRPELAVAVVTLVLEFVLLHFYRVEQRRVERGVVRTNKFDWLITLLYWGMALSLVGYGIVLARPVITWPPSGGLARKSAR